MCNACVRVGGRWVFGSFLNASILLAVYYRHSSTILCYNDKENNLHCSAKINFFRFGTMLDRYVASLTSSSLNASESTLAYFRCKRRRVRVNSEKA
jgi:hypothetical protein